MGHVDPQLGADLVRDLTERREVEGARVGGPASDDDLGLLSQGLLADLVHVDAHGLRVDLVRGDIVKLAGEVELHAVGEVTAVGQGQAHDLVTRLGQGGEHCCVGLRTGVRLDVGELGAEELLGAGNGQVLDDVDVLAATVVAAARVALRVLVGEHGALCLQHGARHEVLRGNHFKGVALTGDFAADGLEDLRVELAHLLVTHIIISSH